jgi:cytochrome c oxidase cbb3-type subunit 3
MTRNTLLTPLMVLMLCFGLSACSDTGNDEAANEQGTDQGAAVDETTTDQDATEETAETEGEAENPPPLDQVSGENVEISLVPIAPGGGEPVEQMSEAAKAAKGNPEAIEIGRQLYTSFNCNGCHFNGGGGMGPPLMDNKWIYGGSMEQIASSIREGRPAGMPSFRAMVQGDTVYKLAAYVQSLSENTKPLSEVKLADPADVSEEAAAMDKEGEIFKEDSEQ